MNLSSLCKIAVCSLVIAACDDNDSSDVIPPAPTGGGDTGDVTPQPEPVPTGFRVTPLVTNASDSDLVNPWGLVGSESVFWIADNATGKVSTFDGDGRQSAEYPRGRFAPGEGITGVARMEDEDEGEQEGASDEFLVPCGSEPLPAEFVFASEDGFLIAINDETPAEGVRVVDRSATGAVYLGVAKLDRPGDDGPVLLAADFVHGRIDMFDERFKLVHASNAFVDPQMPAGFGPFNVMVDDDLVYVMYAKIGEDGDEEKGPGLGAVTIFDAQGNVMNRIKSDLFNAPWGMAIADAGSKIASTSARATLMIGNFGDGHITRFDADTLAPIDQLVDSAGSPIALEGLWGIAMGSDEAGDPNALYFAQGPEDETAGVFGRIDANQ